MDEFLSMVEVRLALHRRGRVVDDLEAVDLIRSLGAYEQRAVSMVAAMSGCAALAATSSSPVGREQVASCVRKILGEEA